MLRDDGTPSSAAVVRHPTWLGILASSMSSRPSDLMRISAP